ncbi:MAG: Gfo/Idh/MocA family oxidoreductase, partial [Chloroflexi bacterium]|nr:Gfo/Idh/MocA family oxidoreductase [Chloroflexota bacterium]
MPHTDSLHVAAVGAGYWGKNLIRNFAQLHVLDLICEASPDLLHSRASQYPGVRTSTHIEDALTDERIDAVVIATPATMHYAHAKAALLHGKHVFVEKPLALHYDEGKELVELARKRGLILQVGHILEFHPAITALKKLVKSGELGNIWYIYSNRLNLGKVRQEENILWSFAPHDISIILRLLGQEPEQVTAFGQGYLQSDIADVTLTTLSFPNEVKAHIFVSWLHPYKEQKLVVIGDKKMAVFDDTVTEGKLKLYDKGIEWHSGFPVPRQTSETTLMLENQEPMRLECQHFLECIRSGRQPLTDGASALRVLKVLEGAQRSLERAGTPVSLAEIDTSPVTAPAAAPAPFVHPTAVVDEGAQIGAGTRIWHFSHVMPTARMGERCNLGQNVYVDNNTVIGNGVKIQNNVSVYNGVILE